MKKLFVSTPMRGKTMDEIVEYQHRAQRAVEALIGEEVELIDTILDLGDSDPLVYLGASITLMADADIVWVPARAFETRGCYVERSAAIAYDKRIIVDPCDEDFEHPDRLSARRGLQESC